MAATIEDITVNYEEDNVVIVKELDKVVLTKGAWSTIIFKYSDWDRRKEQYGPVKYSIRRYRKIQGDYRQQSKFNISSKDQASKIIETLQKWVEDSDEQI